MDKAYIRSLVSAAILSCSAVISFAEGAKDWYVDPVNGDDAAAGTKDAPRRTLKGAMDIDDLYEGDTIWLLPGEYKEGTMGANNTRRLYVTIPGLRFRSTEGRDKTFIVGQQGGSKGYDSDDAIGCVTIASKATGCVFEGITFKDGAARHAAPGKVEDASGGGLYDGSKSCWVIGCRFLNCVTYATAGGMYNGYASGTEFVGCKASGGSSACGSAMRYAEFCSFSSELKGSLLDQGGTFVNCTFYGNNISDSVLFHRRQFKVYNCLAYGFKATCGSRPQSGSGTPAQPDDVMIYNTYFNIYDGNGSLTFDANSRTNADEKTVRFVAPGIDDYRLTDDSDATELGDAAYLSLRPDSFPEGFARKDVYGNPVTATSGAIPAGCALEMPHRTYGRVDFSAAFEVKELGGTFAQGTYFNPIREDYTYMFRPVTDGVVHNVYGTFGKGSDGKNIGEYFFPLRRKDGWVPVGIRPELVATNTFSFTAVSSSYIYYADPKVGNDDYDGKSSNVVFNAEGEVEHGPFRTLMGAMAKIDTGSTSKILYLMPGVYAEGQSENKTNADIGIRYRVYVASCNIGLIGLEGPEKTFIVGAPDPETGGMGPDAIGGVWLRSGTCRCVQGVTITGCYASGAEGTSYQYCGCAFYGGGSTTTYCFDCIISNNTAYAAPIQSYGRMARCKILNNRSSYYMNSRGRTSSCVYAGNVMTKDKYIFDGYHGGFGCTFDISPTDSGHSKSSTYYSLVLNKKVSDNLTQGCCDTIPLVADPAAFDYRLGSLSPAILFGDLSKRTVETTYRLVCDVNGDKLDIREGKMTVGAVHSRPHVPCVAISNSGDTGATVTGGEFGTNVVRSAGEITVTASTARPFLGFNVNGGFVPATERSYSFIPSTGADAATFVSLVCGTNWYVDASAKSDDTPGGSWETARKTIRSATTNAVAGDVIHVAPGEYGAAEGSRLQSSVQTRVIVPANVRLQGEGARYAAVIRGAAASAPEDAYGNGADAIRCVYLAGGATLANFKLTEGHTTKSGQGGAVYSVSTATVTDCLVTNNACYQGTLYQGRNVRCRIVDNNASYRGALGSYGTYYGCFFDHSYAAARNLELPTSIDFCTFGTHHKLNAGSQIIGSSNKMAIRNSVMMYGTIYVNTSSGYKIYGTNCVFSSVSPSSFAGQTNCVKMTLAEMKLSADGVPSIDSPLNNWGDMGVSPNCVNETDLNGNPRVMNGGVDAGAYEYDWRGRYKEDLGVRATSVTVASPMVFETEGRTVRIPSGTLAGTLVPGGAQVHFTVRGGTLEVWLGETLIDTFAAAEGIQGVDIPSEVGNDAFRLVFTPSAADGYAEIASLKGITGFRVIVK